MAQHLRVLILEDEPLISIMVEEMVQGLGGTICASVNHPHDALTALTAGNTDLAILNINLGRDTSLDVAATCAGRGVPVIFITGYTARDLPPGLGDSPVLPKPFSDDELERAIDRALTCRSTGER